MKINYIIIDDEPIVHNLIEKFSSELSYLKLVGNCYTAIEAVPLLKEQKVDLIFLDIKMPKITGFDFLKTLQNPPKVVIVSAYKEYALESYEYAITDYLLKPFDFERFFKSIQKVMDQIQNSSNSGSRPDESIFIKDEKKHHKVSLNDITYVEAYGNYSVVHLKEGKIFSQMKISDLENLLPKNDFSRIHRSYLISHKAITLLSASEVQLGEKTLPIGRVYKKNLDVIVKGR